MICNSCGREFDEEIAAGICPHCGEQHEIQVTSGGIKTESAWGDAEHPELPRPTTPKEKHKSVQADPRWLLPGTVLNDRYEVVKVLGAGGFGITYQVIDHNTDSVKAVKEYFQQGVVNRIHGQTEVLISAPKREDEFLYGRARFLEEARIVAKFQSPSIVRVDDFFSENNTTYMVMEFLDYPTLEEYISARKSVLMPDEAVNIGVRLCDALEEIHRAGVIHRDIAPDNIFITDDGSVKIIDFGSARLSKQDTEDRMIVLKPGYAPPEQYEQINLKNDKQKAWTDIYAVGATLYMALTGRVPVESSNRKADSDRDEDSLTEPREINPAVPEYLNNTIMTAMAINIHERFQNATQMKEALKQKRKVLPITVVRKKKKMRRTAGIAAGFLVAALLFGIGGGHYLHKRAQAELPPASISVWYALSEDETLAQQKEAVLENAIDTVLEGDVFTKVEIETKGIPEADYEEQLNRAAETGQLPTLFETPSDENAAMKKADDLREITKKIDAGSCCFLDDYEKLFAQYDQFPMGFNAPVIYININHVPDYSSDVSIQTMSDFMKLCGGDMKYMPIALNAEDEALYTQMLPDFAEYSEQFNGHTAEDFYNGDAVAYFSDTSDYYRVRAAQASYFAMAVVDTKSQVCRFTNLWSISKCEDEAQTMAAQTLLAYFLSNNVQDRYYLQTNIPGLPLEKVALERYYTDVHLAFSDILSVSDRFSVMKIE